MTDIHHKMGADKVFDFTIVQANGDPYPITGTVYFWICAAPGDSTGLVEKSSPASGIVLDYAAGGLCTVTILRADIAALSATTYHWGLWELTSGAMRQPLAEGRYVIEASVEDWA